MHKAKKSLGQNFLKSNTILNKIIESGNLNSSDVVLEIGPGKGALTEKLLERGGTVIAVEKDNMLFDLLKERFSKQISSGSLVLVHGDILKFNPSTYGLNPNTYKIIANIPYNITGAILKKFLSTTHQPSTIVLMVQHEVAKRIMAHDKKESILSISVKAYGTPKMIMKVPARYFSPQPKVNSAIILINHISRKLFIDSLKSVQSLTLNRVEGQKFEKKFWQIIHAGFAHKRKKLSGNLKAIFKNKKEMLLLYGNKRAEDLSLEDWIKISNDN